jgi:hypothetical protein
MFSLKHVSHELIQTKKFGFQLLVNQNSLQLVPEFVNMHLLFFKPTSLLKHREL